MTYNDVRRRLISKPVVLGAALSMLLVGAGATATAAIAAPTTSVAPSATASTAPLTNLAHLDFLLDTVPLTAVDGHTTYQLDENPTGLAPWTPTPGESQIADGVDSRVQSLVATAKVANAPGLIDVAAITASWYFGANRSGAPAYSPANGTAIDGIERDGRVNPNSGAESTIHALLSMLVLDANPELKAKALAINETVSTNGLSVIEAESGTITGSGSVVTPASAWTGESNWSGGAYVGLNAGDTLTIPVPRADQARNVYPIVNQTVESAGNTSWTAGKGTDLGSTPNGGAGDQGITDAPGKLFPFTLERTLPAGATAVAGQTGGAASVDALLIQPLISSVSVTGPGGDSSLYVSAANETIVWRVDVPQGYILKQQAFDATGKLVAAGQNSNGTDHSGRVTVAAGGFTVVTLIEK